MFSNFRVQYLLNLTDALSELKAVPEVANSPEMTCQYQTV
jgi:hypothetical protein